MARLSAVKLAKNICAVMQDVLVHQRPRWGMLFDYRRQFEGWWKGEFVTALGSWTWTHGLPSYAIHPEAKPKDYGLKTKGIVDLLIAPWDGKEAKYIYNQTPRVWVEIKERGTWWENPKKALGTANHGLETDLNKWNTTPWKADDIVLACHILGHEGTSRETLPDNWKTELRTYAKKNPLFIPSKSVGWSLDDKNKIRWAQIDFFTIHAPKA